MRLFFINRYYCPDESATAQMLTGIATSLAKHGHPVTVITSRQKLEEPGAQLSTQENRDGVEIHRVRTSRFGRRHLVGRALDYLSFYFTAAWTVLRLVRHGDIVIAKTDPPLLSLALLLAIYIRRARLINWWQDIYPEIAVHLGVLPEGLLFRTLRWLRNASIRIAAHNVVIGERMKQFVLSEVPLANITVIPNWAPDLPWSPHPAVDNPIRVELGLSGKVVIGYSGNYGQAHDLDLLLEVSALYASREDVRFLMIGGGAKYKAFREEVARRGLHNWRYLPYQPRERLGHSLGAIDIHIVSLKPDMEGLIVPSKIYGIMAVGRCCVYIGAHDSEIARQLAASGSGIALHPADAPDAAKNLLDPLVNSAETRQRMGGGARKQFTAEYTLDHSQAQWVALIQSLA